MSTKDWRKVQYGGLKIRFKIVIVRAAKQLAKTNQQQEQKVYIYWIIKQGFLK